MIFAEYAEGSGSASNENYVPVANPASGQETRVDQRDLTLTSDCRSSQPVPIIAKHLNVRLNVTKNSICTWPADNNLNASDLYGRLESAGFDTNLIKIYSVRQKRDNRLRLDVYVDLTLYDEIRVYLNGQAKRQKWIVSENRSWRERRNSVLLCAAPLTRDTLSVSSKLHLSCWNIFGAKRKLAKLEYFMKTRNVHLLALQETLRSGAQSPLRISGYSCFESPFLYEHGSGSKGRKGLALIVDERLNAYTIGDPSPYAVFARISGPMFSSPWVIGSIYIPPSSTETKIRFECWRHIKSSVKRFQKQYGASCPILLMGDWNMTKCKLIERTRKFGSPSLTPVKISGSHTTWQRRYYNGVLRRSAIDHMLGCNTNGSLGSAHVDRTWDYSDHWPLVCTYRPPAIMNQRYNAPAHAPSASSRVRINKSISLTKQWDVLTHNYWATLADEYDCTDNDSHNNILSYERTDSLASDFVKTSHEIVTQLGMKEPVNASRPNYLLNKSTKRALDLSRRLYTDYIKAIDCNDSLVGEASDKYKAARVKADALLEADFKKSSLRRIQRLANSLKTNEMREHWRLVKTFTNPRNGGKSRNMQPVKKDGILVSEPQSIGEAWSSYYASLGSDSTGHSKDPSYWEQFSAKLERLPELPNINREITWQDLKSTLAHLKPNKAPGPDELPPFWYQLLKVDEGEDCPDTYMGKCLLVLVRSMFAHGLIPKVWELAQIVSIPKTGDMTLMENYRGISLMSVGVKILSALIARRVSNDLEETRRITRAQAGFRSKEECMGQVLTLVEVVQRRLSRKLRTYLCFIDFKKAFDTVPHAALMLKLEHIGVSGKTLDFIKALYENSKMCVRLASGNSPEFDLERGVRQGDPLSPILFNIFINDILNDCTDTGIEVYRVPRSEAPENLLAGLLLADDVVLIAPSQEKLQQAMDCVGNWATTWEMSVGPDKCGVMIIGKSNNVVDVYDWRLQGHPIKSVQEYKYLGIVLNDKLDEQQLILHHRVPKVRTCLMAAQSFLVNRYIPVDIRRRFFRACVVPVATFGGELFGMRRSLVDPLQTIVNVGMRWICGNSAKSTLAPTFCMQRELRVPPVSSMCTAMRARIWYKSSTLKTWLNLITKYTEHRPPNTYKGYKIPWASRTRSWLKSHDLLHTGHADNPVAESPKAKKMYREARIAMIKILRKGKSKTIKGWHRYKTLKLWKSRSTVVNSVLYPELSTGWNWLVKCRVGGFYSGAFLSKIGYLDPIYQTQCICCNEPNTPESLQHMLLHCTKWSDIRFSSGLANLISVCKGLLPQDVNGSVGSIAAGADDTDLFISSLILGGQVNGRTLQNWSVQSNKKILTDEIDLLALPVVRFFCEMVPTRNSILWRLVRPNLPLRADAS